MYGALPISGGLYEQAAIFLNTLELCDRVVSTLDRKREEANAYLRDMAEKAKARRDV